LANGLVIGSFYALSALGLTLILGLMRVVNFAHGELYMLGGVMGWWVTNALGLDFLTGLALVALVMGVFGWLVDRVLIERMGRTLETGDILPALRQALAQEGMRATDEIDIGSRSLSVSLPLDAPGDIDVRNVQYDRATGRFTVTMIAGGAHPGAQRLTVQGRVAATARLPVLRRAIGTGETIKAADVEMVQVRDDTARRDLIASPEKLIGQVARQRLREREPVREGDVRPMTLVTRNANVTILLQTGNLSLSVQGRSLEEGARGDSIRVVNALSNRQLEAVIVGPDTVAVQTGSRLAALKN
jgi:flagella basal body P-ring formation protein FlgA